MTKTLNCPTLLLFFASLIRAQTTTPDLSADPHWDSLNNHLTPAHIPTVTQNFGFSPDSPNQIGGIVTRAAKPAFYALKIPPLSLNDKFSAAGTFSISSTTAGGGLFFGFFNANQPGAGGRPINSLGLDFDSESKGARLAVRLITSSNRSTGTFITPFLPGKFRLTPLRNDATPYSWTLTYDPHAANDLGQFSFTLQGALPKPGDLETPDMPDSFRQEAQHRFPDTTSFTVDLPPGYKQDNASLDHFGLINMMKPGGTIQIRFSSLSLDNHPLDLSADPQWDASNNHDTYKDSLRAGAQDFGYSPTSHFPNSKPGEIGGIFWRTEQNFAFYASPTSSLTLNDPLQATGQVILVSGAPDSDMCLGWFDSSNHTTPPDKAGNFLGVHIGGPTRVGHYFLPFLTTSKPASHHPTTAPVLTPGKSFNFSLSYNPASPSLHLTLGDQSLTYPLPPSAKSQGETFNHFGLFSTSPGGQIVHIYFQNLQFTTAAKSTN